MILIVDGYNIIHSWPKLKKMQGSLERVRNELIKIMTNYQDFMGNEVKIVFDGQFLTKTRSHRKLQKEKGMHAEVIYSKKSQTADSVIERMVYENQDRSKVLVASSDSMLSQLVRGMGARVISPEELEREVKSVQKEIKNFIGELK